MAVQFGVDLLIDQHLDLIQGRLAGLISNASGITSDLTSNVRALLCEPGVQLIALFGPEHGFNATAADGAIVDSGVDPHTALPVFSLYGLERKPTAEMLDGLQLLIFDIQTVGVRFYTYVTTLLYTLQAAAAHGIPVVVCDRPNPIGGTIVEGPLLAPGYESFVGAGPLPIRHGLTIGELARFFNEVWHVGCELTVVPCRGWRRAMWYRDTSLPWVPPSPAMPWPETAAVYPGTCLVEGTNLSEGRGTALPFHVVGAPWVDGRQLAGELNRLALPGVRFCETMFRPFADKWAGQLCGGVQLHITDRETFRPVTAGLCLISATKRLYPEAFTYTKSQRDPDVFYIDLLAGCAEVRQALDDGVPVPELVAGWQAELIGFRESTAFCLYD
jgi:uncharacterized protein YbbC (DUF1343 family)